MPRPRQPARKISIIDHTAPCPLCGAQARRHCYRTTRPRDLGGEVELTKSIHHCEKCDHYFPSPLSENFVLSNGRASERLIGAALALASEWGNSRIVRQKLKETMGATIPIGTIHDWITASDLPSGIWGRNRRARAKKVTIARCNDGHEKHDIP